MSSNFPSNEHRNYPAVVCEHRKIREGNLQRRINNGGELSVWGVNNSPNFAKISYALSVLVIEAIVVVVAEVAIVAVVVIVVLVAA